MPKKKEKKSVEKQEESRKTKSKDSPVDRSAPDDKEKELYLIQIRYLNEQLERYQLKCDQLERQKADWDTRCVSLEKEKRDVVDYLKRSLLQREEELEQRTEALERERERAGREREALELQHRHVTTQLQEDVTRLNKENKTLVWRLESVEEFQRQREELLSNMKTLEEQLIHQEDKHKADIHQLEMDALLEKNRLEKEMESHVAAMLSKVNDLVEQKLPEATRSALKENAEVQALCDQLTQQTQGLMMENIDLRHSKSRLSADVQNLEQMLRETSRQCCVRKKVVEQLSDKRQGLQAELRDWHIKLETLQSQHTLVLTQRDTLRQQQASLSEQCNRTRSEVSGLETELQAERKRRSKMKSVMQEAAVTLRQALVEAPCDQACGVDSVAQWKGLMQQLLLALDTNTETHRLTSDPTAHTADKMNPALSFQFELARYRPGDLGFVPRPTPKHTQLTLHRKPSSQRTTSSINPTNSTIGFLTTKYSFSKTK